MNGGWLFWSIVLMAVFILFLVFGLPILLMAELG